MDSPSCSSESSCPGLTPLSTGASSLTTFMPSAPWPGRTPQSSLVGASPSGLYSS